MKSLKRLTLCVAALGLWSMQSHAQLSTNPYKFLGNISKSTAKTAETLDMLEKGHVRVRTDIGLEQKAFDSVNRTVRYVVRALMIIALFLGSCMLCTVPPNAMEGTELPAVFPIMGFVGYIVSLWLAYFLYRSVKKGK